MTNAEAGPSMPLSATGSSNRPGARQRRAAAAAAAASAAADVENDDDSTAFASWTEQEIDEAMSLVGEILDAGLAPCDLVRQGVRREIVEICCARLGVAYDVEGEGVAWDKSGQTKSKRKRRKGVSKTRGVGSVSLESDAVVIHEPEQQTKAGNNEDNEDDMEAMLRRKVELERERALLLRMERNARSAELAAGEHSPNLLAATADSSIVSDSAIDPPNALDSSTTGVHAMRLAALSSMKRKRTSDVEHSAPRSTAIVREPPANAPRAPKSRYRDIDAPQSNLAQREQEAADALLMADGDDASTEYAAPLSAQSNISSVSRLRSRPASYVDEEFKHVTTPAPTGYVDHAAPLPSLQQQQQQQEERQQLVQQRKSAAQESVRQFVRSSQSNPRDKVRSKPTPLYLSKKRPAPFLDNQATLLVIEDVTSDESDNDSDDDDVSDEDQLRALKRIRDANTQALTKFWSRERNARGNRSNGSGDSTPKDVELTHSLLLLQSKEREILALKEKMRALVEQRKERQKATDADQRHESDETATSNDEGLDGSTPPPTKPKDVLPAYESPFARFPGLRQAIAKQNR